MFDNGSIPSSVLSEIIFGLETKPACQADSICTIHNRTTTLGGSIPLFSSQSSVGRANRAGLQPGEASTPRIQSAGSVAYSALAYVGRCDITDESVINLAGYGLDILAKDMEIAIADSHLGVDEALAAVLASSSLNEAFDCASDGTGRWDVPAASSPLDDLDKAKHDTAPGADTLVLGANVVRILKRHPDFLAMYSNFSAGYLNDAQLLEVLGGIGFANVHVFDKMRDLNGLPLALSMDFLGNQQCWIGHKSDLIMVDPQHAKNHFPENFRDHGTRTNAVQFTRYAAFARPHKEMGCVFTNIFT